MKNKKISILTISLLLLIANLPLNSVEAIVINEKANTTKIVGEETIANTFPDVKLAKAVADVVAQGDVNEILTQAMIDGLTTLDVQSMQIENVDGIEVLTNLEVLRLDHNSITTLPTQITALTKLKNLGLQSNAINTVPEFIGDFSNLEILTLSDTGISSLPTSIGKLSKLNTLNLGNNSLTSDVTSLPIQLSSLTSLNFLDLQNNDLTYIPESVLSITSLTSLTLSGNDITIVPDDIDRLSNLTSFRLMSNKLTSLPESIGNLTKLSTMSLYSNQLTSLPNSFKNLPLDNNVALGNNLFPYNYANTLNSFGFTYVFTSQGQHSIVLNSGLVPYTIESVNDFNNIDLFSTVKMRNGDQLFDTHILRLENYVDENGIAANIDEYVSNGKIIKDGTLFAQVRATGEGIFPNNSQNAITTDSIQLNFVSEAVVVDPIIEEKQPEEVVSVTAEPVKEETLPKTGMSENILFIFITAGLVLTRLKLK